MLLQGNKKIQQPWILLFKTPTSFWQISVLYLLTVVHVVRNYVLESTIDREVIEKYKFYNYVLEDATNSDREIYA